MRSGPLAWGQYVNWVAQYAWRAPVTPALTSLMRFEHVAGDTVQGVRDAVSAVVRRHEGLRSVFVIDDGGRPAQRVRPAGELEPEFRYVEAAADGSTAASDEEWLLRRFDVETASPARVLVSTHAAGDPLVTLVSVHRLVADHFAEDVLTREIGAELEARRRGENAVHPDVERHPLDVVEFQQSSAGRAQSERAVAYWADALSRAPQAFFPTARVARRGDGGSRTISVSRRHREALSALATEHRATEPAVLTAAMLVVLSAVVDRAECFVSTVTANRFHPGHRDAVCPLADRGPLDVRVDAAADFATVLRATQAGLMRAQRHGYYDPSALRAVTQEVAGRRGVYLHRLPFVSVVPDDAAITAPDDDDGVVRCRTSPSTFDAFHLRARYSDAALAVELMSGDNVVPSATCERIVSAVGHLLDTLPESPGTDLGDVTERVLGPRGARAPMLRSSWFDADAVRGVLERADDVAEAAVVVPRTEDEPLRAVVVPARPGVTASTLGRWVADRLSEDATLVCPQAYAIVDRLPADADAAHGAPSEPSDPASAYDEHPVAEEAIRAAFEVTHGHQPDVRKSYMLAGGRLERAPGLIETLRRQGFVGVSTDDVLGLKPLRAIAGRLTQVS